jgi:inorganic pyrophosphatase
MHLYDERLEDFLLGVAFTPMGYPANYVINSTFGYRGDPIRQGKG